LINGAVGEGDNDVAAAVGRGRELLNHGRVVGFGRTVDIEVGQHRSSVDGHIEFATAGC
jgi:hypothetical protein